jgi:O-antigen/teichoic acid export membrane protein
MGQGTKLTKDTINYGAGLVLPKVIGFLLIPLYTVYVSPAEFGIVDLAVTTGSFMMVVMRLSVPGAISRFYIEYKSGSAEQDYITSIYWLVVGLSIFFGLFFLAIGYGWLDLLVPGLPYAPFFLLIVLSSLLGSNSEVQRRLLQARGLSAYTSKLNVGAALITILLSVALVMWFKLGALGIVLATLFSSLIFFIQAQFYLRPDLKGTWNTKMVRESFNFSIVFFPYHVYGHFAPIVTKSILSNYASLSAVGILAIATKFTQPLTVLVNALGTAFTPHYLELRSKEDQVSKEKLGMLVKRIWFGGCIFFVGFFVFSDWLLLVISTDQYAGAGTLMKLLALGFLPQLFYILFGQELFFRKANRLMLMTNLLSISLSLVLSWLLVERYEAIGAAIAIIAPSYVSALITFGLVFRKLPFNPRFMFFILAFFLSMALVSMDWLFVNALDFSVVQVLLKAGELTVFFFMFYLLDSELKMNVKNLAAKFFDKKSA